MPIHNVIVNQRGPRVKNKKRSKWQKDLWSLSVDEKWSFDRFKADVYESQWSMSLLAPP